jgi:hypothetical protein
VRILLREKRLSELQRVALRRDLDRIEAVLDGITTPASANPPPRLLAGSATCGEPGAGCLMIEFNDVTIEGIFGKEAAEDETSARLKEYFFRNKAYENVILNLPIRILVGHKGIGKSALLKVSYLEDLEAGTPALWLRPGEVKSLISTDTDDLIRLIEQWKSGLTSLIVEEAFQHLTGLPTSALAAVHPRNRILDILAQVVHAASIPADHGAIAANFTRDRQLRIYLDDLDRGWEGQLRDIRGISALLNSLRDLTNDNNGLQFRLGLRRMYISWYVPPTSRPIKLKAQ